MKCRYCGLNNPSNRYFCRYCGRYLEPDTMQKMGDVYIEILRKLHHLYG